MSNRKKIYYRVEIFALRSLGGGHWEDAILIEGDTPEETYAECLKYLGERGYAFESKITHCRKNGEDFQ